MSVILTLSLPKGRDLTTTCFILSEAKDLGAVM
jgi:hypothetical protein